MSFLPIFKNQNWALFFLKVHLLEASLISRVHIVSRLVLPVIDLSFSKQGCVFQLLCHT
jgi:hypothetical protein